MSNSNAKKTWTTNDMINLGEYTNFIRLCVDEDLTLKALAEMYGVSPRTIGRWKERWSTEIDAYRTIRKIEDKYDYGEMLTPEEWIDIYEAHKYLSTRKLNLKDDSDTEPLDIEDLDDDVGEYHDFFHHNLQTGVYVIIDDEIGVDAQKDVSDYSYTFTLTKNSLSIDQYSTEDGLVTKHCDKSNPIYQEFVSNVIQEELSEEQEQKLLAVYWGAMKPALGLETFTKGRIKVDVNSSQVVFIDDDGQEHLIVKN